ncbi:MAG: glycosyltransferase family 4 protein [Alphaproteobacteria bacterium]|nr:glycosyltransferase family 4 protein [Alphaproteobacteria bacterium]
MVSQKILYVVDELEDFWTWRLKLAKAAQLKGWEIHVASRGAGSDPRFAAENFHGHDLPPVQGGFPLLFALRGIIKKTGPGIIHAITLKYALLTGLAALGEKNVRPVYTIAGLGYLFSESGWKSKLLKSAISPFLKLVFRNAQIIVQNPDDRSTLVKSKLAWPDQVKLVRGSGIDTAKFQPIPGLEDNPPLVLMPTRLVHDKGISVFIEAARILKKRGVNASFQIAGGLSGHNPRAITQQEIEAMTRDGTVFWLGRVADMPSLYARAAVIVYPSYYGEGIPRVLLEAASMGKAIVTTDHPGCREAVIHNENGFLVPVKDAEATANAIEKLLRDRGLCMKMGARGRERAEEEFSADLIVKQTLSVYDGGTSSAKSNV